MLDVNMPHITDKGLAVASKSLTEASKEASKGLINVGVNVGAAGLNMILNSRISYALVAILGCVAAYKIVVGIHKGTCFFFYIL